jgi:hypothetical protein
MDGGAFGDLAIDATGQVPVVVLDGRACSSLSAFYDEFARAFGVEEHFGHSTAVRQVEAITGPEGVWAIGASVSSGCGRDRSVGDHRARNPVSTSSTTRSTRRLPFVFFLR